VFSSKRLKKNRRQLFMQNVAKNIVSKGFSNGAGSINACGKKKERSMHIICYDSLLYVRDV